MMRTILLLSLLLAGCLALGAPAEGGQRGRVFDVRTYGAALDGKTDDTAAIMAAFAAMMVNGHPCGTLLIPGVARIAGTLDLDGGYRNVTNEGQWSRGAGEDFRVVVEGALRPDPGIGVAVKLHGARNVWTDIRFDKGGRDGAIGLLVEDLDLADIGVSGTDFAGIVLYADATADKSKRIRSTKIRHVYASSCGQAIEWRGIEAFGSFEFIWDRNCVHGSHFKDCADTTIKYYENFSPATQTVGLHFEECNMFSVGIISLGDRASEALMQITGGNFGAIQRLRVSGRPDKGASDTSNVGLRLVNVKSVNIDNLQTFRCRIGLHLLGSSCSIKNHYSLTGDINPLVIEGTPQSPAPRVDIGAFYRYHQQESVKVMENVTGGILHLHGTLYDMNISEAKDLYAINCQSTGMILDVAGLTQETRRPLAGSIYHPVPAHIRGVAQANLGNPLVHGEINDGKITPNTLQQNASGRTLNLWITVRYAPTADAAATAAGLLGPTAEHLAPVSTGERPPGAPAQPDTLYLRVPPGGPTA